MVTTNKIKARGSIPKMNHKRLTRADRAACYRYPSLFLILALMLTGGCIASQQDVRTLDLRLRTMDNRLDNVDRDLGDLRQQTTTRAKKNSVESLQKNLARSTADLERLRSEILKLKGNMEEVAHRSTINREENQDYINDLGQRLGKIEEQVKSLTDRNSGVEKRVSAIEKAINSLAEQLNSRFTAINKALKRLGEESAAIRERIQKKEEEAAREKALAAARAAREAEERARQAKTPKNISPRKSKKKPGNKTGAKKTISPAAKTAGTTGNATATNAAAILYNQGQTAFKAGKYRDAYSKFSTYLEKYPKSRLAGNSRFWLGDCLYQQNEFALAILEYQKVVDDYKNHPKRPAALLKQGLAFEKLADKKTAKIVYLKLLKLYSGKPEADLAQKRLNVIR